MPAGSGAGSFDGLRLCLNPLGGSEVKIGCARIGRVYSFTGQPTVPPRMPRRSRQRAIQFEFRMMALRVDWARPAARPGSSLLIEVGKPPGQLPASRSAQWSRARCGSGGETWPRVAARDKRQGRCQAGRRPPPAPAMAPARPALAPAASAVSIRQRA